MLIKEGKTNLKYLLIVVILAAIVGVAALWCVTKQEALLTQLPEIKIPEKVGPPEETILHKEGPIIIHVFGPTIERTEIIEGEERTVVRGLEALVEFYIIDPQGRRLGRDPNSGIEFDEIPDGHYYHEPPIPSLSEQRIAEIFSPIDGDYTIRIIGTGTSSYIVSYLIYNISGDFKQFEGEIAPGEIHEYKINY